jgi:uncharacterized ParB-like nuclease family protein
MAEATKSAPQAAFVKKARKVLTPAEQLAKETISKQRAMIGMVQNAEKACKILRSTINAGEQPPKEVLGACSVLSGALANMLGA